MRRSVLVAAIFASLAVASPAISKPPAPAPAPKPTQDKFDGALQFQPNGDGRHMTVLQPYAFVENNGLRWDVPAGAVVDGASIPQIAWSIVGGPYEGRYLNASVIHDWYCDRRTRPWQTVHRMFYKAMLASGVGLAKAKLMYLAVVWGGPRWDEQTIHNSLLPPVARPARRNSITRTENNYMGETSNAEPIKYVEPTLDDRFNVMASAVLSSEYSLDEIDRLAENDPGNVAHEVPDIPKLPFDF